MNLYIGIDLGTSAVKLLLVDEKGSILNTVTKDYPLSFPQPGWSEQNPNDWWRAVQHGILQLTEHVDKSEIRGIGCGGQMHGLVALDENDAVIRPAILWNDGRTAEETDWLNTAVGKEKLSALTANIAFAGFTAPKLLWMKKHEPENFARIRKIMLPKDYINYRLTGVHACDYSDASGMLLLDVEHRRWSPEMLAICGVTEAQMPRLFESFEVIGTVRGFVSGALGLPRDCRVVAGAGDNAAAAVGTGTVGEGACNLSLGTSGTIFISSEHFGVDPHNALHAFAHADGHYHLLGCMLSAASCNKWFCDEILQTTDYAGEQAGITDEKLGRNRVYFLPYLMGERSPINDTDARGTFVGMSMDTGRADLLQAVLEGVAFAIRDSFEVAKSLGIRIERSKLCGGGARSPLWRKIFANVLNIELEIPQTEEGPGYGGAMLAMVGSGAYNSVADCARQLVSVRETVQPDPAIAARYEARYQTFKKIYPHMKDLFKELK
ncbi:MAG: xylulokinase [Oscillospiraceae bacterium]|nr:xylulokinase [Oscillospiraceae bacterium]